MFERLKFMFGFLGAYRRARKAGTAREGAMQAALDEMLSRPLDDARVQTTGGAPLPEAIARIWCELEPSLPSEGAGWSGDAPVEITLKHIALMREMRFVWDGAERGAPMLDPDRPYGRADLVIQLGETFGSHDEEQIARQHVEMFLVLQRALRHGKLVPGRYPLRNISAEDAREAMRGYDDATDEAIGLGPDGLVDVTEDHLKLLREIEIRWPSNWECEERLEMGMFPAAAADPKRPYGDYTFIEVDMARILGMLPPPDGESSVFEPSEELQGRLQRLHWQMLVAMQVFVEQAELVPGVDTLDTVK